MDIERLQNLISYDPDTGSLTWKPRPESYFKNYRSYRTWTSRYCGKEVGCIHTLKCGYTMRVFSLQEESGKNPRMSAHRAAWAIMTGEQPPDKIDHKNQDATDNRWCNLRDGTKSVNERNAYRYRNNTSGRPGVSWSKQHKRWEAHVGHNGKKINLGLFDDLEEAAEAAERKRSELGFSPLHGRARQ